MLTFLNRNKHTSLLLAILIISLALNLYANDFELGYHADEPKKVNFIITNTQDFRHPIFILQVVRFVNKLFEFSSPAQIVILGRVTTAFWGTAVVFLTYKFSKQKLPERYALGAALLTAVSPGIVVHSHYLKEDIAMTFAILLSFPFFFKFSDEILSTMAIRTQPSANEYSLAQHWRQIVLWGLSIGLACATKYQAVIIVLVYSGIPLFIPHLRKRVYLMGLFAALVIAGTTFLFINFPVFLDYETFIAGLKFELKHSLTGHNLIAIYPLEQLFSFHLRFSIIPSLTLFPVVLALSFMLYRLVKWRNTDWPDRFLIVYGIVFYAIVEASPLKPIPGFERYIVPLIPILAYMCMQAIRSIIMYAPQKVGPTLSLLLIALTIFHPTIVTIKLLYYLDKDTRAQVEEVLADSPTPIVAERYAGISQEIVSLTDLDLLGEDRQICTLVASSFTYDRYLFAGKLRAQNAEIYARYHQYLSLFEYPFVEITPSYKSFAFSNPTIRIINLCQGKRE